MVELIFGYKLESESHALPLPALNKGTLSKRIMKKHFLNCKMEIFYSTLSSLFALQSLHEAQMSPGMCHKNLFKSNSQELICSRSELGVCSAMSKEDSALKCLLCHAGVSYFLLSSDFLLGGLCFLTLLFLGMGYLIVRDCSQSRQCDKGKMQCILSIRNQGVFS